MVQLPHSIIDSTLREGEQTPGVVMGAEEKLRLAESLVDAGLKELEAGIPAMGGDEIHLLKRLRSLNARIICWCRSHKTDIEAALLSDTGAVHISLPVSDCQLNVMGYSWEWVLEQLNEKGRYLKDRTGFLSVGAMDASRCRTDRLKEFISLAVESGFGRVRLADTLGICSPETIDQWSRDLAPWLPLMEFHGHNDLGMAVANSLSAIRKGFGAVSTTLFGLGERAGNAPLEEVLLAGRVQLNRDFGISLKKVALLARRAASLAGETIPVRKPLLGERINHHESGIHVAALLEDSKTFTPYDPSRWGGEPLEFIWGKHSGRKGLAYLLKCAGLYPDNQSLIHLLQFVRNESARCGRGLTKEEILAYYKGISSPEGVA